VTYTKKKLVEVNEVVKPSQIYNSEAPSKIREILANGFKIVDFRPVKERDQFIGAPWGDFLCFATKRKELEGSIRFIIKPETPDWWE